MFETFQSHHLCGLFATREERWYYIGAQSLSLYESRRSIVPITIECERETKSRKKKRKKKNNSTSLEWCFWTGWNVFNSRSRDMWLNFIVSFTSIHVLIKAKQKKSSAQRAREMVRPVARVASNFTFHRSFHFASIHTRSSLFCVRLLSSVHWHCHCARSMYEEARNVKHGRLARLSWEAKWQIGLSRRSSCFVYVQYAVVQYSNTASNRQWDGDVMMTGRERERDVAIQTLHRENAKMKEINLNRVKLLLASYIFQHITTH